ncbi:MAG: protease modulator HflC [Ruminococcaceae bacterium]|nr:protease modulator HflC [Oscillospiraceae bacterium]
MQRSEESIMSKRKINDAKQLIAESTATNAPAKKKEGALGIMSRVAKYLTAAIVLLVLFWFGFTYEVREGSCAVVLRFGAVRAETEEAGLYMKLPWPFETVVTYDDRLITLESNRLETTTKDKRNIILQSCAVWEIADPVLYHNSVGAAGVAESYIQAQIFSATNSTLGAYELTSLVSLEKENIKIDEIQNEIFTRVKENCLVNYGINVVDVSILRLSLPDQNLNAVFEQMRADREKDIDIILAEAERKANEITSGADVEAADRVNQGVIDAAAIKAQTETEVAKIYADAQAANIELYKFLKNLDTVVSSVNNSTILVVKADEYPFNILTEYSKNMEIEGDQTVIKDLTYILTKLPEAEREALINGIAALIEQAAADNGITMP